MNRGRPRTLPTDRVRIDLELPGNDARALRKLFPEGYTAALRQLVRDFLGKNSAEWVDQELKAEEERHIEARAFLYDLRELAIKDRLGLSEEQLLEVRQRWVQTRFGRITPEMQRIWMRDRGFTGAQQNHVLQLLQEADRP